MKTSTLAVCGLCIGGAATAGVTSTPRYICERGVEIAAVYINAEDGSEPGVVVIQVEGRMINLEATSEAASGVRYRFPSDKSGYVWWTHQGTATLLWQDVVAGTETPIYADCREG
ncbi:MliC family protein [Loktanella sp. DJP18]|uniref:MliC family protein n=1 Tax=Loktanella sp. DJP18 TaxID=3409788 RepID=UPI003BB7E030